MFVNLFFVKFISLASPFVRKNLYHFFRTFVCSISEAKVKGARISAASGRERANIYKD